MMWKYPSDIREYLKAVLIRNHKWSERQDPDKFSCFSTQEWCAWELPEIALKLVSIYGDGTMT